LCYNYWIVRDVNVMYCFITMCTVHHKSNETVNFCFSRCATTSPKTVF